MGYARNMTHTCSEFCIIFFTEYIKDLDWLLINVMIKNMIANLKASCVISVWSINPG